eukprot:3392389-Rhodomonas_salina.1
MKLAKRFRMPNSSTWARDTRASVPEIRETRAFASTGQRAGNGGFLCCQYCAKDDFMFRAFDFGLHAEASPPAQDQ